MPRDHARALDIQKSIDEHAERIKLLEEELAEADPAVAHESALRKNTVSIRDIEFLTTMERGRLKREFEHQMTRVLRDIQDQPFSRDATGKIKTQARSVEVKLIIKPETELDNDSEFGVVVDNINIKFKVSSSLPKFESAGCLALIEHTPDGLFKDVRTNPDNPFNPRQLALPGTT